MNPENNPYNQNTPNQPNQTQPPQQNPQLPYFMQEQPSQNAEPPKGPNKVLFVAIILLVTISLVALALFFALNRNNNTDNSDNTTPQNSQNDQNEDSSNNQQNSPSNNQLDPLVNNQHDNQRRNILSKYISEGSEYIANQNGKLPINALEVNTLLAANDEDIVGTNPATNNRYVVVDGTPESDQIQYAPKQVCDGSELKSIDSSRQYSFRIRMSDGSLYCTNN